MRTPALLHVVDIEALKVIVHSLPQTLEQLLDLVTNASWRRYIVRPVGRTRIRVGAVWIEYMFELHLDLIKQVLGRVGVVKQILAHNHFLGLLRAHRVRLA